MKPNAHVEERDGRGSGRSCSGKPHPCPHLRARHTGSMFPENMTSRMTSDKSSSRFLPYLMFSVSSQPHRRKTVGSVEQVVSAHHLNSRSIAGACHNHIQLQESPGKWIPDSRERRKQLSGSARSLYWSRFLGDGFSF